MFRSLRPTLTVLALSLALFSASAQTPDSQASPTPPAPAEPATSSAQPVNPTGQSTSDEQPPAPIVRPAPPANAPEASPSDQSGANSRHKLEADAPQAQEAGNAPEENADKGSKANKADKADKADTADKDKPLPASSVRNPILWHDPGNIAAKDLFNGQGGAKSYPKPPFTFLQEDKSGTNPKFDARDGNGKKWRVKLGEEARPEVVASRLLWAIGYYANDDYNLKSADIEGLNISRGHVKGTHIEDARFARKPGGQEKIAIWAWKDNPFLGTREFDGLRVMMAVLNNWDLKDINNSVYFDEKTGHQVFLVNDVGASFATNSLEMSRSKDKGNLSSYKNSKFITKRDGQTVNFATPAPPNGVLLKSFGLRAPEYFRRSGFQWIGQNIPVEHARWIGQLLGRLSVEQIHDAFRAGNFPPEQADIFADLVHNRILELQDL